MKATCCVVETAGNPETHQCFSSDDESPYTLLPPALFSLCSPGVKHLELFLVQMLLSPIVLSYAALVHVVIEAAPALE